MGLGLFQIVRNLMGRDARQSAAYYGRGVRTKDFADDGLYVQLEAGQDLVTASEGEAHCMKVAVGRPEAHRELD